MRGQLQPGPAPTLAQALKATEAAIEDAGEAAEYEVKWQWPIPVTNAHAEIGNMLTTFLGTSSALCSSWFAGRAVNV